MSNKWHVPSLRGVLGNWVIYPSLMSAKQISERVIKSKDIRESEVLDDYLQRNLKPRVKKIVRYLKTRDADFSMQYCLAYSTQFLTGLSSTSQLWP